MRIFIYPCGCAHARARASNLFAGRWPTPAYRTLLLQHPRLAIAALIRRRALEERARPAAMTGVLEAGALMAAVGAVVHGSKKEQQLEEEKTAKRLYRRFFGADLFDVAPARTSSLVGGAGLPPGLSPYAAASIRVMEKYQESRRGCCARSHKISLGLLGCTRFRWMLRHMRASLPCSPSSDLPRVLAASSIPLVGNLTRILLDRSGRLWGRSTVLWALPGGGHVARQEPRVRGWTLAGPLAEADGPGLAADATHEAQSCRNQARSAEHVVVGSQRDTANEGVLEQQRSGEVQAILRRLVHEAMFGPTAREDMTRRHGIPHAAIESTRSGREKGVPLQHPVGHTWCARAHVHACGDVWLLACSRARIGGGSAEVREPNRRQWCDSSRCGEPPHFGRAAPQPLGQSVLVEDRPRLADVNRHPHGSVLGKSFSPMMLWASVAKVKPIPSPPKSLTLSVPQKGNINSKERERASQVAWKRGQTGPEMFRDGPRCSESLGTCCSCSYLAHASKSVG